MAKSNISGSRYFPVLRVEGFPLRFRVSRVMARTSYEAELAVRMAERIGIAVGDARGEDTAGRAVLRLLPVEAVVERACDMAQLLVAEFEGRGWIEQPSAEVPEWYRKELEEHDERARKRERRTGDGEEV